MGYFFVFTDETVLSIVTMLATNVFSILVCFFLAHATYAFHGNISMADDGIQPRVMLTNLATILRNAGLDVTEVSGWATRGHGQMTAVKSIICHHTAGPATGDMPSLNVIRDGTSSLAGPLAQLGLGRSGKWFVVAAGLSYHAGVVTNSALYSNANAIGIEAEGTGLPATNSGHTYWPEVQYQSYLKGVRALMKAFNVPKANVLGHKEVASPLGRKIDPNFSMDEFRNAL
ncbi:unnamed protein product [Adineta ricciae]|uniref:N-acetylmuramoyl-L-alanine amidase n=2 Tax=Adineta ricciae TaxID=249248 RepID=A0A814Q088_ADIRI|nr:unnamed protein product [Adineta ricciae]